MCVTFHSSRYFLVFESRLCYIKTFSFLSHHITPFGHVLFASYPHTQGTLYPLLAWCTRSRLVGLKIVWLGSGKDRWLLVRVTLRSLGWRSCAFVLISFAQVIWQWGRRLCIAGTMEPCAHFMDTKGYPRASGCSTKVCDKVDKLKMRMGCYFTWDTPVLCHTKCCVWCTFSAIIAVYVVCGTKCHHWLILTQTLLFFLNLSSK